MKASELILKLQELIKENGDIECRIEYQGGLNPVEDAILETNRSKNEKFFWII